MLRYDTGRSRATVTIDDPDRHNPLTNAAMGEMADAIRRAASDDAVRTIVLTGAGDRSFSAGGDLSAGFVDDALATHASRGALGDLLSSVRSAGKPVVARVNGHALGGGFGLVAAAHFAIASNNATFGMPEVAVGLWPMMITVPVVRALPRRLVLDMMITGRRLDATEALEAGIVTRVVEQTQLDGAVDEIVDAVAQRSPAAVRLGLSAFHAVEDMGHLAALDHLHLGLTAIASTADAAEGVAAFLEKRSPNWSGS